MTKLDKQKTVIFSIPESLHYSVRLLALQQGISMAELFRRASIAYLTAHQEAPHA